MRNQRGTLSDAQALAREYHAAGRTMVAALSRCGAHEWWELAFQVTTVGLIAKACDTVRGALMLLEVGLVGEAQVLLRVLVETTVTMLAIGKDPENRALLYSNFQYIAKYRLWKKAAVHVALRKAFFEDDPRHAGRVQEKYDQYKGEYIGKTGKVRNKWHEEGSVSDLAKEVGLGDLWDAMYGIDSALVHSGPDCLLQYVRQLPGRVEVGQTADEAGIIRILLDVSTCMERLLDHFGTVFPDVCDSTQLGLLSERRSRLFSRDPL